MQAKKQQTTNVFTLNHVKYWYLYIHQITYIKQA